MPPNALPAPAATTALRYGATRAPSKRGARQAASEPTRSSATRNAAGRARRATTAWRGARQTTRRPAQRELFSRPREARARPTARRARAAYFAWRRRLSRCCALQVGSATRWACRTPLARANVRGATTARRAASAPRRLLAKRAASVMRQLSNRKPTAAPALWAIRVPRRRTSRLHVGLGRRSATQASGLASTASLAPS